MDGGGLLCSVEDIEKQIIWQKSLWKQLDTETRTLETTSCDRQTMTKEFRDRYLKHTKEQEQDKEKHLADMDSKMKIVERLQQEQKELREELNKTQADLKEEEAQHAGMEKAADVNTVLPQREVVFLGTTRDVVTPQTFDTKTCIKYPMEGGTALITFEEEAVAQRVRSMPTHKITLEGGCYITVEARPIQLTVPASIEVYTGLCSRSILVSQLPAKDSSDADGDILLDKLELHFSKGANGGGEVVSRHLQEDTGNVVLVFKDDDIALGLTKRQYHDVLLPKKRQHSVRVSPFVNGRITHFEVRHVLCARSVLLTGIPAILDPDNLQDMVEIYFQKGSNGGGEICNIVYNPLGRTTVALFEEDV